ncbi:MAG: bifunctional glutamate N-acetyltransferase/amino-acid acetyltransferase ArgJ [Gammaproteobacteria bacterium]|nr:bifunctional glutamate N-acetyltransferase/amino-acid acetyltransferase ArgJ [Gammaproteobacteria bacterium]
MAVGEANFDFHVVPGVRMASFPCGIKSDGVNDLVMFEFVEGSVTAAVFTKSLFAAAPVEVGRRHLKQTSPRYFVINSGNANAATGDEGIADSLTCCKSLSQLVGARPEEIIPFSTGVIGERLPVSRITDALHNLLPRLGENNWLEAARGIMTTDTRPKIVSRQKEILGKKITITGIAKGSGMIQPNMATMLSYIATDVSLSQHTLQGMLDQAVNKSFNRITVDSDTSTNDSCMLTATGVSGLCVDEDPESSVKFYELLEELMIELAKGLVRDAEGATKFVAVRVINGEEQKSCLAIAYVIANSPLVKTAIFASDANWGRIVMAIGKVEADIDISKLDIYIGDVRLMANGTRDPGYVESMGDEAMSTEEITITVDLKSGDCEETVWTSDLSHEYVRINAEYRT